jgi:hypothetical protein
MLSMGQEASAANDTIRQIDQHILLLLLCRVQRAAWRCCPHVEHTPEDDLFIHWFACCCSAEDNVLPGAAALMLSMRQKTTYLSTVLHADALQRITCCLVLLPSC